MFKKELALESVNALSAAEAGKIFGGTMIWGGKIMCPIHVGIKDICYFGTSATWGK